MRAEAKGKAWGRNNKTALRRTRDRINYFAFNVAEASAEYGATKEPVKDKKAAGDQVYFFDAKAGIKLIKGNCMEVMARAPNDCADLIFADPPYFLSNNGVTCHAGRMVSVNKGRWDASKGVVEDHEFIKQWLAECKRILKPDGTIWVSGTLHVIYSVGYAMQELGYKILNDIVWEKPNPPPNLACRYFTHSTEIVLWARKSEKARHHFDYALMKKFNGGRQMKNIWKIATPGTQEKRYGKHPTQKPIELLERIILAGTKPGALVVDPFMGSGTTGVAAVKVGRRFIGIELEDNYLSIALKRVTDAVGERQRDPFTEESHAAKVSEVS